MSPDHPDRCRSCRALIVWARTQGGAVMPVDAAPDDHGNVRFTGNTVDGLPQVEVLGVKALRQPSLIEEDRFMPHHANCPQGKDWKRR